MAKSFKSVATPARPEDDRILDFMGRGRAALPATEPAAHDTPAVAASAPAPAVAEKVRTSRLSLDIPESLHTRYKAACARARLKMTPDLIDLIEVRVSELEKGN